MNNDKILTTLASVGTSVAAINWGVRAMFEEGLLEMAGASHAQVLTGWYLLAFLGAYSLYLLASRGAGNVDMEVQT